jgi:hypothetical protein
MWLTRISKVFNELVLHMSTITSIIPVLTAIDCRLESVFTSDHNNSVSNSVND